MVATEIRTGPLSIYPSDVHRSQGIQESIAKVRSR